MINVATNIIQRIHRKNIKRFMEISDISVECGKIFLKGKSLKTHKQKMHTDIKLDCDQCSYKHNTKNSLKEHKELFMKISDMPAISVITELQE